MDTYNRVLDIIVDETGYDLLFKNQDLDLIANDIIDSLAFINILDRLNEEFNIEIQPTQVTSETWKTVKSITCLVESMIKKWINRKQKLVEKLNKNENILKLF